MYSSAHSLTSTLGGSDWSALRPGRFTPREKAPATPWVGGWVGPKADLDAVVKRKIPSPCGGELVTCVVLKFCVCINLYGLLG
jgi:hypothetical protein